MANDKSLLRQLIPGLVTLGFSVFFLTLVLKVSQKPQRLSTQAATTSVWQCYNATSYSDCSNHVGCSPRSLTCPNFHITTCPTGMGCQTTTFNCPGLNESTCKLSTGCTANYTTPTYTCSNSNCPSSCTKKPVYSSCTTSTCGYSGCSCSTSYYCSGPSSCSSLGTSYACYTKRSIGCSWSSRTNVSGSYVSGTSCTGTYTGTPYFSSCSGQYKLCTGTGYACEGPNRICNAGETGCPAVPHTGDYLDVCNPDGQGYNLKYCPESHECSPGAICQKA